MKRVILLTMILGLATAPIFCQTTTRSWIEQPSWGRYFSESEVQGCFLLYDLRKDKYFSYNTERVNKGFLPASTYKILNSLIALEFGVVRDESEVLKWDGVQRIVPAWNKDQNMTDAFKNSTVWFYQEMARRIGRQRMKHFVDKVNYGNRNISGGLDHFWLDGGLRITAKEQIDFLSRLYRNQLPFSAKVISIVKKFLITEQTDRYVLRAKTGWVGFGEKTQPQLGWAVGYVEREGQAYFFAMNLDIQKEQDASTRMKIAMSILREMRIIDP